MHESIIKIEKGPRNKSMRRILKIKEHKKYEKYILEIKIINNIKIVRN